VCNIRDDRETDQLLNQRIDMTQFDTYDTKDTPSRSGGCDSLIHFPGGRFRNMP